MKIISIPQLGSVLLQARKEKGFRQKYVLEQVSISRTSLYELENGLREHLDLATILELLALYDLSLEVAPQHLKQKLKSRVQIKKGRSTHES